MGFQHKHAHNHIATRPPLSHSRHCVGPRPAGPGVGPGLGQVGQLVGAPDQELAKVQGVLLAVVLQQHVAVALAHPAAVELKDLLVGPTGRACGNA